MNAVEASVILIVVGALVAIPIMEVVVQVHTTAIVVTVMAALVMEAVLREVIVQELTIAQPIFVPLVNVSAITATDLRVNIVTIAVVASVIVWAPVEKCKTALLAELIMIVQIASAME